MTEDPVGLLDRMAGRFTPTAEERRALLRRADDLMLRARAVARELRDEGTPSYEPILVGSAAKDTWLPGNVDLDLFLLFSPDLPRAELESVGLRAGKAIFHREWRLRYAEHPYVHGTFDGVDADVVPAYKVEDASRIQSAVDRTPFHNAWVIERLTGEPQRTRDIRLAKAWLRGIGAYGAETAMAGLSGYLTEVLVLEMGGFMGFVRGMGELVAGARIDPRGRSGATFPGAPVVVIDPVDPKRNVAAAVSLEQLVRVQRAARAFLARPSERFFLPVPLAQLDAHRTRRVLGGRGLVFVRFPVPDMREDAVVPHVARAAESLGTLLAREGFDVVATAGGLTSDAQGAYLFVATTVDRLPALREHVGPPVRIESRASEFRAKYEGRADVTEGPYVVGEGDAARVAVRLRVDERLLQDRVRGILQRSVTLGKHVDAALASGPVDVLDVDAALATADLGPVVCSHLSAVDPWDRTGDVEHDYPV